MNRHSVRRTTHRFSLTIKQLRKQAAAYRRRVKPLPPQPRPPLSAPEVFYEQSQPARRPRFIECSPGAGYRHPCTIREVRQRLDQLPASFLCDLEVVRLGTVTRKRKSCPCYGMQWGWSIYLYGIEEDLVETYDEPPTPQQLIEARMYGGQWIQDGKLWKLQWTERSIKDYYLHHVLIHEVGHLVDDRNSSVEARENFAEWFAIHYGYRWMKAEQGLQSARHRHGRQRVSSPAEFAGMAMGSHDAGPLEEREHV